MQTTRGSILLAAALFAGCVFARPVLSQDCPLPALETDGFVRVEGGRLMLGDQRFHVRGANYHGGRFIDAFPSSFPGEEVYEGSAYFRDPWFLPDEIEAELAFHREKLGTNAIRIFYQFTELGPIGPVALDRIKQFLCRARRQGIRVQFAFLVRLPTTPEEHNQYVAGYGAFFQSLLPAIKDDPTVLSYEIGNEIVKQNSTQEYKERIVRLIRALIGVIRTADPNHLVTSGEVAGGPDSYPSPEFVPVYVDGPSLPPVRLEELVDYISPHFYNFPSFEAEGGIEGVANAIRQLTTKPVVGGEFGYEWPNWYETDKAYYQAPQKAFFARFDAITRNACPSPCPPEALVGFDGWMPWSPLPIFDLRPTFFAREKHDHHGWLFMTISDVNKPTRYIHYRDWWELFYYPDELPTTPLKHLPAGLVLRKSATSAFDFGGDGVSDVGVYRASSGEWRTSSGGVYSPQQVSASGVPAPADYDGDARVDPALFRPSAGEWLVRDDAPQFLGQSGDVPTAADYDGDGEAEIAVFRPADATWHVKVGLNIVRYLGVPGDIPVPADYDGDGAADLAVYQPMSGTWTAARLNGTAIFTAVPFGSPGDVPVVGDFDGNGVADIAVYRPSNSTWHVRNVSFLQFGTQGDLPVPADYDGDGRTDIAVYRPAAGPGPGLGGQWLIHDIGSRLLGVPGDHPVPLRPGLDAAAFVGQSVPSTMSAGHQYEVSVTFTNTGTRAWSPLGNQCQAFRLTDAIPSPGLNGTWGLRHVELPSYVDPGQSVAIAFLVTAPSTPGNYGFQWRMIQQCVQAFGSLTPNVVVNVTP